MGVDPVPLGPQVSRKLGRTPVHIDNDVRVAILGEFKRGAGRPFRNFLGVFVGTGDVTVTATAPGRKVVFISPLGAGPNGFGNLAIAQDATLQLGTGFDNIGNKLYSEFPNASFFRPEPGRNVSLGLSTSF